MSVRDTDRTTRATAALWGTFPATNKLPNTAFGPTTGALYPGDLAVVSGSLYRCTDAAVGSAAWEKVPELADVGSTGYGEMYKDPNTSGTTQVGLGAAYQTLEAFDTAGALTSNCTPDIGEDKDITLSQAGIWKVDFSSSAYSTVNIEYAVFVSGTKERDIATLNPNGRFYVSGSALISVTAGQTVDIRVSAASEATQVTTYDASLVVTYLGAAS